MKKTKEEYNLCLLEVVQKIDTYRKNSQRKSHLISYEEEIRRAKAFCRQYWITECSKILGVGYNAFLKWLKTRNIQYV